MLVLLSPSKTQSVPSLPYPETSVPKFQEKTIILADRLRKLSEEEIKSTMHVSDKLARLTWERFQEFSIPPDMNRSGPALLFFQGDVFHHIDAKNYGEEDFSFAQGHLRILSGLYGILRPLDLIQPYRLEIGGKFRPQSEVTLYDFWKDAITSSVSKTLRTMKRPFLVNLASNEYFKVINTQELDAPVIAVYFKQYHDGKLRTIAIHAKKARGALADFIIKNRLLTPEDFHDFSYDGYCFSAEASTSSDMVFIQK